MEESAQPYCSFCSKSYNTQEEADACTCWHAAPDPYRRGQGRPIPRPLKGKRRLKWLRRQRKR